MGNALALIGCVGIIIGVIALIRGRLGWARIRSRKVAAIAIAGSVVALAVGATIVAPARPAVAQPLTGPPPVASSTSRTGAPGSATTNTPPTPTTAGDPSSAPVSTPPPVVTAPPTTAQSTTARAPRRPAPVSTAAVTAVAADVQQAGARRAVAVLATLAIRGRAPMTGYSRAQFGSAWTDDNDDASGHNGCDTRIICTFQANTA